MSTQGPNFAALTLPQPEAFQADMLIWRSAPGMGAIDHPGHAAVVLRRQRNEGPWRYQGRVNGRKNTRPAIQPAAQRYISFWPDDEKDGLFDRTTAKFRVDHLDDCWQEISSAAGRALGEGRFAPRAGQIVLGSDDRGDDIWGQWPQVIVSIPGLSSARQTRLGLHLNRMVEWAQRFKASDEFGYTFVSKGRNCAGVAVRALVAGGGDAFAAIGGHHGKPNIFTVPNDAQHWAEAVLRGVQEVNRMLEVLRDATAHLPAGPSDLMSYRQWRTTSHVALTIRGPQTVAIDKALQDFHAARWLDGHPAKFGALVTIIKAIRDHMRRETKRETAYLELAREVMGVVAWLARSADQPWAPADYYVGRT